MPLYGRYTGQDVIGMALQRALEQLGASYGQKITTDWQKEQAGEFQKKWGDLLNRQQEGIVQTPQVDVPGMPGLGLQPFPVSVPNPPSPMEKAGLYGQYQDNPYVAGMMQAQQSFQPQIKAFGAGDMVTQVGPEGQINPLFQVPTGKNPTINSDWQNVIGPDGRPEIITVNGKKFAKEWKWGTDPQGNFIKQYRQGPSVDQQRGTIRIIKTDKGLQAYDTVSKEFVGDPIAQNPIPPTELQTLSTYKNLYNTLEDLTKRADKNQKIFGPLEGKWTKLKLAWKEDPNSQTIVNELSSMIRVAYALSGKQISFQEMEMLKNAILPQLEQPYGNFKASLEFAKKFIADYHNTQLDYWRSGGYNAAISPLGVAKGQTSGPNVGDIQDGFKFKGGDPSKSENWEKVP